MKTSTNPTVPEKQPKPEVSTPPAFPTSSELARALHSLENEQQAIDKAEAERLARLRAIQSLD